MTALKAELARAAAEAAAVVLREKFQTSLSIRSKAPADMVTEADLAAEKVIVDLIRESFPSHSILAEESHVAEANAEHLWVIDPLDGTTNFVHGIPHVAVSIAYYQSGEPKVGVVCNPIRGDWYTAISGMGAFVNDQPARVSEAGLAESVVGVGFYYDRGMMMRSTLAAVQELFENQIHGIRRMGTAALDLCMVGTGQFGAFFEYQLSPWDFAAGRLFVEEAGGSVTTCDGGSLPLAKTSVLAASPATVQSMKAIVGQHLPSATE
ncbi:MAG: inositol monophosphatase family protein [Planctomycetaceae bacterium]